MSQRTELFDAALAFAARGIPVFPCRPRSKEPITAHGFHEASTDIAQVERWWWSTPRANVAVPTGIVFDVVDFDRHDVYEQALETHVLDGPQVRTGRGAHFYVAPTGKRCTKLSPKVDFKAIGGYVLTPPSVHPTGALYSWICECDPRPAPAWLNVMLAERNGGTTSSARAEDALKSNLAHRQTPDARGIASLRAMAERIVREREGNRNALLFWCAVRAADTGISADDVAFVLRDAAQRAGLEDREIDRTLESAFGRWP